MGPRLPEPILTEDDTGAAVELAESVLLALLVVLEALSPLERAVFVLSEAFDDSYVEIGEVVGRNEAAVRYLGRRACEHVRQRRPRFNADHSTRRPGTERFLAACNTGDIAGLMANPAPGVPLYADGGGRGRAPRRPIVGADKVARFFLSIWKTPYREWAGVAERPDPELRLVQVNDGPAILGTAGERPIGVLMCDVADGVVQALGFVANPDTLSGLMRGASA